MPNPPDFGLNMENRSPPVSVAVLATPTADDAFSACVSGFCPKENPPKEGLGGSAAILVVAGEAKLPKMAGGASDLAAAVVVELPNTNAPVKI